MCCPQTHAFDSQPGTLALTRQESNFRVTQHESVGPDQAFPCITCYLEQPISQSLIFLMYETQSVFVCYFFFKI